MRFLPVSLTNVLVELTDLGETLALFASLAADPLDGIEETVPAARTLMIRFDPTVISAEGIAAALCSRDLSARSRPSDMLVEIPVRHDGEDLVSPSGDIRLRQATPERLLLTATILARSVVLARDESRIADAFDRIEPLVNDLRTKGRAGLPIPRVMQHIGDVLATQHRVVGRVQISEKPDLLWDHPELDRLYGRLEAEFELSDRARTIERKLEVIGDAADVLLELVQDKRSLRLELAVIMLITFEVLLNFYEFWRH